MKRRTEAHSARRSRARGALAVVVALSGGALAPAVASAAPSADFSSRLVIGHLARGVGGVPTAFAYAPDGRVFVARKAGVVDVYDRGKHHVFLDLTSAVNSAQGRGMLGLALDPHFATNGRVYVMYTSRLRAKHLDSRGRAGGEIISVRARADDPNTAALSTRVTLLTGYDSSAPQHADGALRFDRAGHLFAGWGDGTADQVSKTALAAQSLDDLRGKIVRIDAQTGAGVPGNPWYRAADPNAVRSKVYAYGLRNPYRFSIDPQNGTLYVGDVGWNRWDELDAFTASNADAARTRNGGWPCYEGNAAHAAPQPQYRTDSSTATACSKVYGSGSHAPLYAYPHGTGACVIAGPKYTGTANYPARYKGNVFVADWTRDSFTTVDPATEAATAFGTAGTWGNPLDIQIAPDGNVAYLAQTSASLREITYSG